MHDVGVTLHIHQIADFDAAVFADAAQVIAPRSTSMTCSARSFSSESIFFSSAASSASSLPRGWVPAMGRYRVGTGGSNQHFRRRAEDVDSGGLVGQGSGRRARRS